MTAPRPSDAGASSLLGFIVAMAIVVASMGVVVYTITTTPDSGMTQESRDLQGAAQRIVETLTRTPGTPENWHELPPEEIQRVGLLEAVGSRRTSTEKVDAISSGALAGDDLANISGLTEQGFRVNVTGQLIPAPLLSPPPSRVVGVAHFADHSDHVNGVDFRVDPSSLSDVERFEAVNTAFDARVHDWEFAWDQHPTVGVGNVVPDHTWTVETQLFPKMAGLAATYATQDDLNDSTSNFAEFQAMNQHTANTANRWRVVQDGKPLGIPGGSPSGDHVLTVAFNYQGSGSGLGEWKTINGGRAWSVIGPVDVTGTENLTFSFKHLLHLPDEDEVDEEPLPPCYEAGFGNDCWALRPSILFWNATAFRWERIDESSACGPSNWDDSPKGQNATGANWIAKDGTDEPPVDLCEAREHAQGQLWLALYWDIWCNDGTTGTPESCAGFQRLARSWFLDDLQVEADNETLWSTDLEPMGNSARETLLVSSGVNHTRTHELIAIDRRAHAIAYVQEFIRAGGNVISLAVDQKGRAGDWLGEVGLETVPSDTRFGETVDPDNLIVSTPWGLPDTHDDYVATELVWSNGPVANDETGEGPTDELHTVQALTTRTASTLVRGQPFGETGGRVVAVGYNLSQMDDPDLATHIVANAYAGSMFLDASFQTDGQSARPERGTVPLQSAKRVALVPVTSSGVYQAPMEVTVYVWPG